MPAPTPEPAGSVPGGFPAPRLRLVAAAHMRLAVAAAVWRAFALVQLGGVLLAHLVGVVLHLAGVAGLFVMRVLFAAGHGALLGIKGENG